MPNSTADITIEALLVQCSDKLAHVSDTARLDCELLLAKALGQSRTWLRTWPDKQLDETQHQQFTQLLEQREQGEPIAHILGKREFWSLELNVNPSTLIPRPDTEKLVEVALEKMQGDKNYSVLDLGTGTGAIALAIAGEKPGAEVTATDTHEDIIALAKENARLNAINNVKFIISHWFDQLPAQRFDLVVSNPPYIDPIDPHLEQGDVRFEPRSALVAENHGMADLLHIIKNAHDWLKPGGWLIMEHGYDQADRVQHALKEHGYQQVNTLTDYQGNPRVSLGSAS